MFNAASTATRRGLAQRLLGLVQVGLGDPQVALVGLDKAMVIGLFLRFATGLAMLCALRAAQVPLQVLDVVGVLPPVAHPLIGAQARSQFDHLARGVKEQVDISRIMHIRLNNEGVATPMQDFAFRFFFDQFMTRIHDDLVDLVQQVRRE
jgi:hypothetical protein